MNKICELANIGIINKNLALGYSCVMNMQDKSKPSSRWHFTRTEGAPAIGPRCADPGEEHPRSRQAA